VSTKHQAALPQTRQGDSVVTALPMALPTRSSLTLFVDNSVLQPFLVFIVRRIAARYIEGESLAARDTVLRIRFSFLPMASCA
jgi:hypothetical protein